jgi:hypothetical protein
MPSQLRWSWAVAASLVAAAPPVSGFAQTDSRGRAVLMRSSHTVIRPYVEQQVSSIQMTSLPENLHVTALYRDTVATMLMRSPTFRRQCLRIAATPSLRVVIEADPPVPSPRALAYTHISRHGYGRMLATVRVSMSSRVPELIAHELEHVLEQLDGVDLDEKSRLPESGVRMCDCGGDRAYETTRAVATGQRVAREIAAR